MLQPGNSASWNEIKTGLARFLQTIAIKLCSRDAAEEDMSQYFERWRQSDKFMNALVERIVSSLLCIRPVTGFMKRHVDLTIDKMSLDTALPIVSGRNG